MKESKSLQRHKHKHKCDFSQLNNMNCSFCNKMQSKRKEMLFIIYRFTDSRSNLSSSIHSTVKVTCSLLPPLCVLVTLPIWLWHVIDEANKAAGRNGWAPFAFSRCVSTKNQEGQTVLYPLWSPLNDHCPGGHVCVQHTATRAPHSRSVTCTRNLFFQRKIIEGYYLIPPIDQIIQVTFQLTMDL